VQGTAGFGLTNSVDGVAMTGAVAPMVLVGAAVGWRRLCTTGSVGRCMGDGVDAVLFRVPAGERGGLSVARGRRQQQPLSCTVRDEMEKKEEKTYVCEGRAAAGGRACVLRQCAYIFILSLFIYHVCYYSWSHDRCVFISHMTHYESFL
jgi:hypothetical protein